MCKKNKALFLLVLVCLLLGLLVALAPLSDLDHDGLLDSLITAGSLIVPVLFSVTVLFSLLYRLPSALLGALWPFSRLLVPPPISAE